MLQGKQVEAGEGKEGAEEAGQKRRGMEDAALRDVTQFLAQMQDTKVHGYSHHHALVFETLLQ